MLLASKLLEFLNQELNSTISATSNCKRAYSNVCNSLSEKYGNLGNLGYDLDDESHQSVAAQFHRFFPTHFYKFYVALLQSEIACIENEQPTSIVGWPIITILDIGCGGGAASLAALCMVEKMQRFLFAQKLLVSPVVIELLAIDPSQNMLDIFTQVIQAWDNSSSDTLINVVFESFEGAFPTDFRRLLTGYDPKQRHNIVACMSNVIRPLSNIFDSGVTVWEERLSQALNDEKDEQPRFGFAEARAIRDVAADWNVNQIALIGVAVGSDPKTGTAWSGVLDKFLTTTVELLDVGGTSTGFELETAVTFSNFPNSYFSNRSSYTTKNYFWKSATIFNSSYFEQTQLFPTVDGSNLELAWVRSRNYSQREYLVDEVEIALFDRFASSKLDILRCQMLQSQWEALLIDYALWYQSPKNHERTRPRVVPRLAEQIVSTAIVQILELESDDEASVSFSYRLNPSKSEYLYIYWLKLWKSYLSHTQKAAADGGLILRTDISGFFQHIDQQKLLDSLQHRLISSSHLIEILRQVLIRDCGIDHEAGKGLLQGHIASGVLANFYLQSVDKVLADNFPAVDYARYTDDMVFVVNDMETTNQIVSNLEQLLSVLDLSLSEEKTERIEAEDYVADISDNLLDEIQNNRLQPLLRGIFRISDEYTKLFQGNSSVFLEQFKRGLASIGLQYGKYGLRRRIKTNSKGERKLIFPDFLPTAGDGKPVWADVFVSNNHQWVEALDSVRHELVELFEQSLLERSRQEQTIAVRARRRLSYSANRLCSIGLPAKIASKLTQIIIDEPWAFRSLSLLCTGIARYGYEAEVLSIYTQSDSPVVRALALRAMADLPQFDDLPQLPDILRSVAFDQNLTDVERLKSSEAMLVRNVQSGLDIVEFQSLIATFSDRPFLQKNFILLFGYQHGKEGKAFLWQIQQDTSCPIIFDAVQFCLHNDTDYGLVREEPESIMEYYSDFYPIFEYDEMVDPSPS